MAYEEAGTCIVGSELHGVAKDIRDRVKDDERILKKLNDKWLVLKDNCESKIIKESKLPDEEYKNCMRKIRESSLTPIDQVGSEIKGSRIYVEYSKKPKKLRTTRRQQVIIKSKIAVAQLSKQFIKSGVHTKSTRYVKNHSITLS